MTIRSTHTAVLAVISIGVLLSGCAGTVPASPSSTRAASASSLAVVASPTIAATPTPRASPTGPAGLPESGGGRIVAGTYSTHFQPALTLSVPPDGSAEVFINEPGWIDLGIGFDPPAPHQPGAWYADFMVVRLDKIIDPEHPGSPADPPENLGGWIATHPGLEIVSAPRAVKVGGLDATQVDVRAKDATVVFGPIPGIVDPPGFGVGGRQLGRTITMTVDGRQVLIWMGTGEGGVARFDRVVDDLQPYVDSIRWQTDSSDHTGQIVFENFPNAENRSQIWIEAGDGSNARQLVTSTSSDESPTLSPDGRTVIFTRLTNATISQALVDPTLWDRIMVVKVDGTDLHQIDTGGRPALCDDAVEGDAWSPDGLRIAFTRICFDKAANVAREGIWTANADGSDAHEVTWNIPSSKLEDHRADWSPDGQRLAFARIDTSVTPEMSAIFTVGTDGTGIQQITPWDLDANDPAWAPDGALIAFNSPAVAGEGGEQDILTIQSDGTGLQALTAQLSSSADGTQGTFHPTWSPDGKQILFTHSPATGGSGDLFVMDRDGGGLHVLAETILAENHAAWGRSQSQ